MRAAARVSLQTHGSRRYGARWRRCMVAMGRRRRRSRWQMAMRRRAMREEAPCVFDVADPPCRDCTDEDDDDTDMQIGHYAKAKREAADAPPR